MAFRTNVHTLPQLDGSAGIFQPLDDIFDEATSKIIEGTTTIQQEDITSLTKYDCIIDALKRVCDFQGMQPTIPYSSVELT